MCVFDPFLSLFVFVFLFVLFLFVLFLFVLFLFVLFLRLLRLLRRLLLLSSCGRVSLDVAGVSCLCVCC